MLSWLKKLLGNQPIVGKASEPPPAPVPAGNPAKGFKLQLSVQGPAGQREARINLVETLSQVFGELGRECVVNQGTLTDVESGVEFRPGIVSFEPKDDLSMRMCTTIEVNHPTKFPRTFFEYQHSVGATAELALTKGFEDWARVDLPVVLDSMKSRLQSCTALEMSPAGLRVRRIVLGPVWHLGHGDRELPPKRATEGSDKQVHSSLCPCCLFSNSVDAFLPLVQSNRFCAVRLFAMRNADGTPQTDCRVNGEDYPEGAQALAAYVRTWVSTGLEMRKQYIVIQDQPSERQTAS